MGNPCSPEQETSEAQFRRSPANDHGCQAIGKGHPKAHRQTRRSRSSVAGFQPGQPQRECSCAEESRYNRSYRVYRPPEQYRDRRRRTEQCQYSYERFKTTGQRQQESQRHRAPLFEMTRDTSVMRQRPVPFHIGARSYSASVLRTVASRSACWSTSVRAVLISERSMVTLWILPVNLLSRSL